MTSFPQLTKDIVGLSEETTTGVHRLYERVKKGTLKMPAINVNGLVHEIEIRQFVTAAANRLPGWDQARDERDDSRGKIAVVAGYGRRGQGLRAVAGAGRARES